MVLLGIKVRINFVKVNLYKMIFNYGIEPLTASKALEIAHKRRKGCARKARSQVEECRYKVEVMAQSDRAVYGINTGFGPLCDTR
ncbi:MAG: aromatic amino acid lyase, partial [Bacteroidota bacterium]